MNGENEGEVASREGRHVDAGGMEGQQRMQDALREVEQARQEVLALQRAQEAAAESVRKAKQAVTRAQKCVDLLLSSAAMTSHYLELSNR